MSENSTTEEHNENVSRFERIVADVKEGRDLHNDDALFLVNIVGSLDTNFTVSNMVIETLLGDITEMCTDLGTSVLRRAGRTDQKIRRSVQKIVDGHVEDLFNLAQLRATEYMRIVSTMREGTTEEQS
jgi:hypothetical protein